MKARSRLSEPAPPSSRYELLHRIGSGGMAIVYAGRIRGARGFTRAVAIKRAHPYLADEADFRRMLIALEEPESLIDRKVIPNQSGATFQSGALRLISRENAVSSRLRHAVEQTLRRRRPLAVLVDDAQHLAIMGSGRKLLDQINTIKSIANLSQITHVLTGTYELMTLRHLNGQLSRRSVDIEFNRYLSDNSEHREAFINCLWTFQQHLPLPKTPELVNQWDYFYERSIGCVGVLKDWLTGALALALENGAQTLTSRDLER